MRVQFNMKIDKKLLKEIESHVDGILYRTKAQFIEVACFEYLRNLKEPKKDESIKNPNNYLTNGNRSEKR